MRVVEARLYLQMKKNKKIVVIFRVGISPISFKFLIMKVNIPILLLLLSWIEYLALPILFRPSRKAFEHQFILFILL